MLPGERHQLISPAAIIFLSSVSLLLGAFFTPGMALKWLGWFEINHSRGFENSDLFVFFAGWLALYAAFHLLVKEPYALGLGDTGVIYLKKVLGRSEIDPMRIQVVATGVRRIWWEDSDARVIRFTLEDGKAAAVSNFEGAEAFVTGLLAKYPHIKAGKLDFAASIA